jgi:hypothetical protein
MHFPKNRRWIVNYHFNKGECFMKKQWVVGFTAGALVVLSSCANNPSGYSKSKTGGAEIWASLEKPQTQDVLAKTQATEETTWDSLVVMVTGDDMDTMVVSFKFSPSDPYISASVANVPAGKKRMFTVFTKTKSNLVIHISTPQVVDISPSEVKTLDFTLVPILGSIYVDLSNIPTNVERICASFDGLSSCADRAAKLYLSIDDVPDKTSDSLVIEGTDTSGLLCTGQHSGLFSPSCRTRAYPAVSTE